MVILCLEAQRKGMVINMEKIAIIVMIAIAAVCFIKIFTRPIKFILKLLLNMGFGFLALWLFNLIGKGIGVTLGLNWLNAVVVGLLGLPGVALLLILKWLLVI